MKKNNENTHKALREVWAWKDSVSRETSGKNFSEVKTYFAEGMNEAAKILGASIITNSDGSYSFKR